MPTALINEKIMDFSGLAIKASQFMDESGNAIDITPQTAITDLTDSTGGTADSTLVAISGTYSQTEIRNNMADMAAKINAILAALRSIGLVAT